MAQIYLQAEHGATEGHILAGRCAIFCPVVCEWLLGRYNLVHVVDESYQRKGRDEECAPLL
jgi:hypothetical protein